MKKSFVGALKSKTMWFNVLTGILAVTNALQGQDSVVSPEISALIIAVGNVILRVLTTKSLSSK
jgi:hypothetical protein